MTAQELADKYFPKTGDIVISEEVARQLYQAINPKKSYEDTFKGLRYDGRKIIVDKI